MQNSKIAYLRTTLMDPNTSDRQGCIVRFWWCEVVHILLTVHTHHLLALQWLVSSYW